MKRTTGMDEMLTGEILLNAEVEETLFRLCDEIGDRSVGSEGEARSAAYLTERLKAYGISRVTHQSVPVSAWRRGHLCVKMVAPFERPLDGLSLANSGTHSVAGQVIEADFSTRQEWLDNRRRIENRVVLCSAAPDATFSDLVLSRKDKIELAVSLGAAGFLWASVLPGRVPEGGSVSLEHGGTLPCLGISMESAALLRRSMARGSVTVEVEMQNSFAECSGTNVIAEIPGARQEAVVIGAAHHDGHDFTDAAHDNAAGVAVLLETARALSSVAARPEAAVRIIFFTGEEVGCVGSRFYVDQHAAELDRIRFAFTADGVGFLPARAYVHIPLGGDVVPYVRRILRRLNRPVSVEHAVRMGWDHGPFALRGVPSGSITIWQDPGTPRHWGHTEADTVEKLDMQSLRLCACDVALLLYEVANAPDWPGHRLSSAETRAALLKGMSEEQLASLVASWGQPG